MATYKKSILKYFILGWFGGSTYCSLEVIFRGRSHWSMVVLAFILFLLIGSLNNLFPWEMSLAKQGIIGACMVTVLEFITGCIVNIWLGWNVWDYSNMSLNILGQVCLPFSLLWILLSIVCIIVDDYLRYLMFNEQMPHYYLFTQRKE
jgi:uncharacterized membrane protein